MHLTSIPLQLRKYEDVNQRLVALLLVRNSQLIIKRMAKLTGAEGIGSTVRDIERNIGKGG